MPEAPSHRQERPKKQLHFLVLFFRLHPLASRAGPVTLAEIVLCGRPAAGRQQEGFPSCKRNTDSVNMQNRCWSELMEVLEITRQQCCKTVSRSRFRLVASSPPRFYFPEGPREVPMVNYLKTEVEKNV